MQKRQELRQEFRKPEQAMRGRKPNLNWQKSKGQYTTTIDGQFFRLGREKGEAEEQFRFLLNKFNLGEPADSNPLFSVIVDKWLGFVEDNHDPERFRLCYCHRAHQNQPLMGASKPAAVQEFTT
jgi:hypothetical protein